MVIPPLDQNPNKYFVSLNELNKSLSLENLSMGMSADYIDAIKHGSNFVRVGSSIFWFSINTLVLFFSFFIIFNNFILLIATHPQSFYSFF